jgi:hypothetical protein
MWKWRAGLNGFCISARISIGDILDRFGPQELGSRAFALFQSKGNSLACFVVFLRSLFSLASRHPHSSRQRFHTTLPLPKFALRLQNRLPMLDQLLLQHPQTTPSMG